jgi:hypothetical protein
VCLGWSVRLLQSEAHKPRELLSRSPPANVCLSGKYNLKRDNTVCFALSDRGCDRMSGCRSVFALLQESSRFRSRVRRGFSTSGTVEWRT